MIEEPPRPPSSERSDPRFKPKGLARWAQRFKPKRPKYPGWYTTADDDGNVSIRPTR